MTTTTHLGARELIERCVDDGTWQSWDQPINPALYGHDADYLAAIERARLKAGTDESVITGQGRIHGHGVALIVSEFGFLGGSVGRAAGRRITDAVRRATGAGLPLIAATASGGTRMQEGTPAFLTMVDITRAIVDHRSAGLPYLVYLRHPTMGGVFASWASLGHMTVAEPGALIGFLGPRVYEALHGSQFPDGVQTAEHLVSQGILDAVAPVGDLPAIVARALALLGPGPGPTASSRPVVRAALSRQPGQATDAWTAIGLTRRTDRPGVRQLLRDAAGDTVRLQGTQAGEATAPLLAAITSFDGERCLLVAQDRHQQVERGLPLGPGALRGARRAMRMAEQLRLPLVCVIDTPGAELSVAAEEGALAPEIARCMADLSSLHVPTVSVILGQGSGGGALALLPARRVIAAQHSWLAPLAPEGASAILFGDTGHAAQMARRQRITAQDLAADGRVDAIVPEQPAAHLDPHGFSRNVAAEIANQIRRQRPDTRPGR